MNAAELFKSGRDGEDEVKLVESNEEVMNKENMGGAVSGSEKDT